MLEANKNSGRTPAKRSWFPPTQPGGETAGGQKPKRARLSSGHKSPADDAQEGRYSGQHLP